jgi:phospholipase C
MGSDLEAVEHIVFLMMENRSYDHYFGDYPRGAASTTIRRTRSACSPRTTRAARTLVPPNVLLPFHLEQHRGLGVHRRPHARVGPAAPVLERGKMDSFVKTHTSSQYEGANGAMTMGYYQRADLASTTRWPTRSRSATATTARSSGRRTPTG